MTTTDIALSVLIGRTCDECFYKVARSNSSKGVFAKGCIFGHHTDPLPEEETCENWQPKHSQLQWLKDKYNERGR